MTKQKINAVLLRIHTLEIKSVFLLQNQYNYLFFNYITLSYVVALLLNVQNIGVKCTFISICYFYFQFNFSKISLLKYLQVPIWQESAFNVLPELKQLVLLTFLRLSNVIAKYQAHVYTVTPTILWGLS